LEVLIEQDGEKVIFDIEKEPQEDIGLILQDLEMRKCGNKCIFCFIHQNPKGMRRAIYFKDEDYRFSFLYGHYVTLTNTSQKDLERIVDQQLSPLYVSVHVTNTQLRKYMLGIKFDDLLLEKIEFLTERGIELHCQIVLCPDLNDGKYLDQTIDDLKRFYPGIKSIAIVPVGLTKHRKNLPVLKPVTHDYAIKLFDIIKKKRQQLKSEIDSSFIFLSDEFYIRTGTAIPNNDYYEGFYQLENGVGLTRDFINLFQKELPKIRKSNLSFNMTFVSGALGTIVLEQFIIPEFKKMPNIKISMYKIINKFFGESIVVSGLLVGRDLFEALKTKELGDNIILPPRVLNHDGLFLDDWSVKELENKLNRKIYIFPGSFVELFQNMMQSHHKSKKEKNGDNIFFISKNYVTEKFKGNRSSEE
jgi:putative radical SAM enzyme (TIGR03279 family)